MKTKVSTSFLIFLSQYSANSRVQKFSSEMILINSPSKFIHNVSIYGRPFLTVRLDENTIEGKMLLRYVK